jgi:hypothetical protein
MKGLWGQQYRKVLCGVWVQNESGMEGVIIEKVVWGVNPHWEGLGGFSRGARFFTVFIGGS